MRRLVKIETTQVYSWLIGMMSYAYSMKRVISRKTSWGSRRLLSKTLKMISGWSWLKSINTAERSSLARKNYPLSRNLPKNYWNFNHLSSRPCKSKPNSQPSSKTQQTKIVGDSLEGKTQMRKLSMLKLAFYRNA